MASFLGKLRFLKSPLTRRLATSVDASYKDSLPAKVSGHPEAGMEYQIYLNVIFSTFSKVMSMPFHILYSQIGEIKDLTYCFLSEYIVKT